MQRIKTLRRKNEQQQSSIIKAFYNQNINDFFNYLTLSAATTVYRDSCKCHQVKSERDCQEYYDRQCEWNQNAQKDQLIIAPLGTRKDHAYYFGNPQHCLSMTACEIGQKQLQKKFFKLSMGGKYMLTKNHVQISPAKANENIFQFMGQIMQNNIIRQTKNVQMKKRMMTWREIVC